VAISRSDKTQIANIAQQQRGEGGCSLYNIDELIPNMAVNFYVEYVPYKISIISAAGLKYTH